MANDLQFERSDDGVRYGPAQPAPPPPGLQSHNGNLAQFMPDRNLDALSEMLTENVAFDEQGQEGVSEIAEEVTDLIGLGVEAKPDTEDEFSDRSSHTLMLTALMRFQAKAIAALLPTGDMAVRTQPVEDLDAIADLAAREARREEVNLIERRVQEFYTDYLFKRLPAYEDDTDQLIKDMGEIGIGIRKIVVDRSRRRTPVLPERVRPGDLVVSYDTQNFRVGRLAHKMDLATGDLIRRMNTGLYRALKVFDTGTPEASAIQSARDETYGVLPGHYQPSATHRCYEVYTDLFLDDDPHPEGLPRPYIVTVHQQTREILAVQRNWQPWDPDETPLEHFVGYLYHPGRSAVSGVGIGQILMQTTRALRSAQRRMLEAGYLQNHPSGFKLSSLTIRDGETRVKAGEFVDVDSPTGDIRSALYLHPFQGPSPGLMQLAQQMLENGRELGGMATVDFTELMKSGVPAGPAMAAFEEATEFQTAVHRRLYLAHRRELSLIHERLQSVIGDRPVLFGHSRQLQPGDLAAVEVLPFMKPGQASRQREIMEAQAVLEIATAHPDIVSKREAAENYIRALGSPDADRMLISDDDAPEVQPADPVTEYAMLLAGNPIKAGPMQNHAAHIDAHRAQLGLLSGSSLPVDQGTAASAVLSAHIAEHMGLQALVEVSRRTGIPMESLGPQMPPELEARIAPAVAEAMAALQAEMAPEDPEAARVTIERIRQEGALAREQMKLQGRLTEVDIKARQEQEVQMLRREHEREMASMKEAAAMDREIEDNAMALRIARMRAGGSVNAAARAGNRDGG